MAVSSATNLALLLVGYILDQIIGGFTFATIALMGYHDFLDLISANTHIDPHSRMWKYDSNCIFRTNWFDLARTHCSLSKRDPLNTFEGIEQLSTTVVDDLTLPAHFWEQSDVPSPWNTDWTEAAKYGGGLELDDPIFGSNWTTDCGAHVWCDWYPEWPHQCEGHNYFGTYSIEGYAPAESSNSKICASALDCYWTSDPDPLRNWRIYLALVDVLDSLRCQDQNSTIGWLWCPRMTRLSVEESSTGTCWRST